MIKINLLIPVIFLIILAPVPVFSEDVTGEGTITFISGTCLVKDEDKEYKQAVIDQTVYSADTIRTLENSEVEITLNDENKLFITEDSEITLYHSTIRQNRYTNISLLFGSIKVFVNKLIQENDQFSINTISSTAGVRGTKFDVSVRDDGAVLINVDKGLIETEFNGAKHKISEGNASVFLLSGERKDQKGKIDYRAWRKEAVKKIMENPEPLLRKMLERERFIIQRLIENQKRIEEYRKEWIIFLKKVQYLENRQMYEEERRLILFQTQRLKYQIYFINIARRNLSIIRSIIILTSRIEKTLDPETVEKLSSLEELKREYIRVTIVIRKLYEAERRLREVLFVLNKKLKELR